MGSCRRPAERGLGETHGLVGPGEAVAVEAAGHLRLDLAPGERGGERAGVEHLLDDVRELRLVVGARLAVQHAAVGDDVAGNAAVDDADVGGGLVVEPSEPHVGDRAAGGGDRGAALLRRHPRVRGLADEGDLHDHRVRRAEDHLADRPGLVVDVPDAGGEARAVERLGAAQAHLLLRREQELEARVRDSPLDHAAGGLDHGHDRRLVVGAEDRAAGVPDDPVLDHRLDRPGRRHRVHVRAEEERRPLGRRLQPRVQVPGIRADLRPGVVLVDLESERAQLRGDAVGDGALLPGWRRQRGEVEEEVERAHCARS